MELLQFVLSYIVEIFGQQWLPNFFGATGGFLGFYSFVDKYILKFNPKLFIGTRIITEQITEHNDLRINRIFLSLEISNDRKKYGSIYDLSVRLYKANEINPDTAEYFASEIISDVPINIEDLKEQEYKFFNPISISPESSKSVNIVFSEVLHRSKLYFAKRGQYYLELYIQVGSKKEWKFIEKLYLFNHEPLEKNTSIYTLFTAIENESERENFRKTLKPQRTSLYEGITQKYFIQKRALIKSQFIYKPYKRIKDFGLLLFVLFLNLFQHIIDLVFKIPILNKYSKKISEGSFKIGRPECRENTAKAFQKIYARLKMLSENINIKADEKAKVTLQQDNNYIILSRNTLTINIYIGGDTTIVVQEQNFQPNSKFTFMFQLKKRIHNFDLWYLENYGYISVNSFAVKIMDTFIIHSSY